MLRFVRDNVISKAFTLRGSNFNINVKKANDVQFPVAIAQAANIYLPNVFAPGHLYYTVAGV